MPNFDILIVSWERLEYLKRTIASLIQSGAMKDASRIIIVDNGSIDQSVRDFLEQMRLEWGAFLVFKPHNKGWGEAVNDALGISRAEYLLVSNNDVEYQIGFHTRMFEIFEKQANIGILGVWRHIGHGLVRNGVQNENFCEMDNVPAIGWMIPKTAMQLVGLFPEHGPCLTKGGNGEDTSYVNRMKEKGLLVGVPPKDLASHIDGY